MRASCHLWEVARAQTGFRCAQEAITIAAGAVAELVTSRMFKYPPSEAFTY